MKRILTVLVALIIIVSANAQFFIGIEGKAGASNWILPKNYPDWATPLSGFSYSLSANIGVELLEVLSASVGIEYMELNLGGNAGIDRELGFRIPLKIGYYHYFGRLKPFANVGAFYSIKPHLPNILPYADESVTATFEHLKNYFGYLAQAGIGYRITRRITVSAAYEYNRPFNETLKFTETFEIPPHISPSLFARRAFYFSGAVIGATISF